MRHFRLFALLVLICAGCADPSTDNAQATGASTVTPGGTTGGSTGDASTGAVTPTTQGGGETTSTTGATTGGGDTATSGASTADAAVPPDSTCQDDPSTLGNDCPGVVTCTDAMPACSLTAQNCCVKDYKKDAVSCNEGTMCDGLASAACDGAEDCSDGQVCCISVSLGLNVVINHRCVPDVGSCSGGNLVNRVLCHSDDTCDQGQGCEPIGNLPWWGICK